MIWKKSQQPDAGSGVELSTPRMCRIARTICACVQAFNARIGIPSDLAISLKLLLFLTRERRPMTQSEIRMSSTVLTFSVTFRTSMTCHDFEKKLGSKYVHPLSPCEHTRTHMYICINFIT